MLDIEREMKPVASAAVPSGQNEPGPMVREPYSGPPPAVDPNYAQGQTLQTPEGMAAANPGATPQNYQEPEPRQFLYSPGGMTAQGRWLKANAPEILALDEMGRQARMDQANSSTVGQEAIAAEQTAQATSEWQHQGELEDWKKELYAKVADVEAAYRQNVEEMKAQMDAKPKEQKWLKALAGIAAGEMARKTGNPNWLALVNHQINTAMEQKNREFAAQWERGQQMRAERKEGATAGLIAMRNKEQAISTASIARREAFSQNLVALAGQTQSRVMRDKLNELAANLAKENMMEEQQLMMSIAAQTYGPSQSVNPEWYRWHTSRMNALQGGDTEAIREAARGQQEQLAAYGIDPKKSPNLASYSSKGQLEGYGVAKENAKGPGGASATMSPIEARLAIPSMKDLAPLASSIQKGRQVLATAEEIQSKNNAKDSDYIPGFGLLQQAVQASASNTSQQQLAALITKMGRSPEENRLAQQMLIAMAERHKQLYGASFTSSEQAKAAMSELGDGTFGGLKMGVGTMTDQSQQELNARLSVEQPAVIEGLRASHGNSIVGDQYKGRKLVGRGGGVEFPGTGAVGSITKTP